MKSLLFCLVIFSTVAAEKCKKAKDDLTPSCIMQKIDQIKKEPKWNPPATVKEFNYKGKKVYYFSAQCCDQYDAVYDENCNFICAPGGGFTGKGDGECADFNREAKEIRVVWKDER